MRLVFDINHPADVHQFRNIIKLLMNENDVLIVARENKDSVVDLLNYYNLPYKKRAGYNNIIGKLFGLFYINLQLLIIAKRFKADILIGSSGDIYVAQVSRILRIPSIILDDTEHSTFQNKLTFPFATKIITPVSYLLDIGKKQIRYDGTKEMCYLSNNYFKPDINVKNEFSSYDKVFFVRFISWDANHDIGQSSAINKLALVHYLENFGKVFISMEGKAEKSIEKYIIPASLRRYYHSVLYYSDLVITEGASTAAEAAVLGTPCIYINPLMMGYIQYFIKLERLVHSTDFKQIKSHIDYFLKSGSSRKEIYQPDTDVNHFIIDEIKKEVKS